MSNSNTYPVSVLGSFKNSKPKSTKAIRSMKSSYLHENVPKTNSPTGSPRGSPRGYLRGSLKRSPRKSPKKIVEIKFQSELTHFYRDDPPNKLEEVELTITDGETSDKSTYGGPKFDNTRRDNWGNYKLYGTDLNMSQSKIERIRTIFKLQGIANNLIQDFYYPLRCIQGWWNTTFTKSGINGIKPLSISIKDIKINQSDIDDIQKFSSNEFSFDVNITKPSEDDNNIFNVTINVKCINNTENRFSISGISGGLKKRSKRKRRITKRKISKRRRH